MKIPKTKRLESILTILLNTSPFLYSDLSLSSRCMKSNSKQANKKQKKQANEKIPTEFVIIPNTMRGKIIATCSLINPPYSLWNKSIVFWVGVNSERNLILIKGYLQNWTLVFLLLRRRGWLLFGFLVLCQIAHFSSKAVLGWFLHLRNLLMFLHGLPHPSCFLFLLFIPDWDNVTPQFVIAG